MEQTVAEIKPYRPKKGQLVLTEEKVYEFELVYRNEAARPVDKKTGLPLGSGFPPSKSVPNRGNGFNKKTNKWENWRYIEGQPSIWVSEQPELADWDKIDVDKLMGEGQNDLEFRDGRMLIRGDAAGQLKIQALMVSEYFVDCEKPRKATQPAFKFKLNNPDAIIEEQNDYEDLAFRTMQQARNCTITEMLAVSSLLGINIDDTSPAGMNRIKNQFLSKAKYDPKNPQGLQFFMDVINNPATKMKYTISQGLLTGLISTTQQPGKLTWTKLNTPILDLTGKLATTDELVARAIDAEKAVVDLLTELEKQLSKK